MSNYSPTTGTTIDRSEIARAWAKTLAYICCGRPDQAAEWWDRLLDLLRDAGLPR